MINVTIEGSTGEGVIWTGEMSAIPSVGDHVCIPRDEIALEVRTVIYDVAGGGVIIRAR